MKTITFEFEKPITAEAAAVFHECWRNKIQQNEDRFELAGVPADEEITAKEMLDWNPLSGGGVNSNKLLKVNVG